VATIHTAGASHVTHADTRFSGVTVDVRIVCGSKGSVEDVTVELQDWFSITENYLNKHKY
jgi:hypothetical protein